MRRGGGGGAPSTMGPHERAKFSHSLLQLPSSKRLPMWMETLAALETKLDDYQTEIARLHALLARERRISQAKLQNYVLKGYRRATLAPAMHAWRAGVASSLRDARDAERERLLLARFGAKLRNACANLSLIHI